MIEELLPKCLVSVETRGDHGDIELFPEEAALIERAVEKRRREFITARACARTALRQLGLPITSIPTGERGEPLWPEGVVGSITHCDGYRACALARSSEVLSVGIDAEPNAALPDGLLGDIARPEELPWLRRLGSAATQVHWDRLLFSAKESVYKAWFPLAKRWLGFEDAVITIDPGSGSFSARLLVSGPPMADGPLQGFSGRWMVREGIVLTAIAVIR
ncbi:MAG TPA: 4'-phosphopantetheinyl transferase superfamily protein [Solirubrobacteraceae bacterium]